MTEAIGDKGLQSTLARFAALAARVLDDPAAWIGDDPSDRRTLPIELARRVRRLASGRCHPGSRGWADLPVEQRARWWIRRIQAVAAPIAASPRILGVVADRVPIQDAFGTAVAGLAVCAVAREHGVPEPAAWVPLLGRVLFERDLARPDDAQVVAPRSDTVAPSADAGLLRRGGAALWRLARVLWGVQGLFDERPRGAWLWRAVGKVPIVGLAGGVLDERGAVARAARETAELLRSAPPAVDDAAERRTERAG